MSLLKISEAASLGIHAVSILASHSDKRLSTPEIAAILKASEAHLSKVMQRLAAHGVVDSVRGPRGGFMLIENDETSLLDIYEAIEGPLKTNDCLLNHKVCQGADCVLGDLVRKINRMVKDRLSSTKISYLCGEFNLEDKIGISN